jgi:glycosyltransferase involved in cell wall biosynthesis
MDGAGRRPRIAAVIPVLDEAGAIGTVVGEVPRDWVDEVVVVDGGSRDGTATVAAAAGARVIVEPKRGYGRACSVGAAAAAARGAEILVFLDGDGSDRPGMIPRLVAPILEDRCDFVIGSRTRGERERGSMGLHQRLAGRLFGALCGLVCGVRYTDMSAFRAIRAAMLVRLQMRETTYGWNLEMQMRAARAGLWILEIPVLHRRRLAGRSKVAGTFRGTLKAGFRILWTFARLACEARPSPLQERGPPARMRAGRPRSG